MKIDKNEKKIMILKDKIKTKMDHIFSVLTYCVTSESLFEGLEQLTFPKFYGLYKEVGTHTMFI